jgi:prephenate dehydrogenase
MTRVAMSPSELWIEICQLNRSQILKSLHRFLKNLHLLESAVQKSDTIFLRRFFENASRSLEYEQRKRI